jgi:hypothetical protein
MTSSTPIFVVCLAALSGACSDNLQIKNTNLKPVAVARVLGGEGLMPSFVFSGEARELTLDGSASSDPDGQIRVYRWASATPQRDADDAGADDLGMHRRWVPDGAEPNWPDDVEQPVVQLSAAGRYAFTLWVIDDQGLVSDPSSVTLVLTSGVDQ